MTRPKGYTEPEYEPDIMCENGRLYIYERPKLAITIKRPSRAREMVLDWLVAAFHVAWFVAFLVSGSVVLERILCALECR